MEEKERERGINSRVHVEKSILVSHGESNWDDSQISASNPIKHIIGCLVSLQFHSKVIPFSSHQGTCVFLFFISGSIIFVQIHIKKQFFLFWFVLRLFFCLLVQHHISSLGFQNLIFEDHLSHWSLVWNLKGESHKFVRFWHSWRNGWWEKEEAPLRQNPCIHVW